MVISVSCSRKQPELKLIDKQNFIRVIDNKQVNLFILKINAGLLLKSPIMVVV